MAERLSRASVICKQCWDYLLPDPGKPDAVSARFQDQAQAQPLPRSALRSEQLPVQPIATVASGPPQANQLLCVRGPASQT